MNEQGIIKTAHPTTGEPRWEAIIKIKGNYVFLGWWSTHAKALKAYKEAMKT